MRIQRNILKLVFLFLFTNLSMNISWSQQVLDGIVAIVDDDVILKSEVDQNAYLMAVQSGIDPTKNPKQFNDFRKQILQGLINKEILLIQADKDTVQVEERIVDYHLQQQMDRIIQQLGGEDKVEEHFKTSITKVKKNYREQIREELRIQAVREQKVSGIKITRREVEEFYRTHKDSIPGIKETVDISHILIKPKPGKEATDEAIEKIKGLKKRIDNGEDFSKLATTFSDDPGTAERGGDLGFVSRGSFVREFEQVAFNLKPGQVSDPVKTQYGYHVIKMIEKRGEKIHVKHILVSPNPTREDLVEAADKIKSIHEKLKNGENFEALVKEYSEDETTVEKDGHLGTFEIDQLRETAKEFVFAISDTKEGEISEPVKTKFGFHVIRVNSREEPRELSLENDWERIKELARGKKTEREFQEWVSEIKQNVYVEIKELANL
jgi:peptidyl-prolyl cis-trans isomerase SurA